MAKTRPGSLKNLLAKPDGHPDEDALGIVG